MGMIRGSDGFERWSRHVTRTARWRTVRMAVLERDGWRCCDCGARGRLEVHHTRRVKDHPESAYDPAFLRSLCPACHTRATNIEMGRPPLSPARIGWTAAVRALTKEGKRNA